MKPIRLLLLFLFSCPLAVYAQTAEVGGAVQDPSGAVIPKASLEFRNQDTGVRRRTTTNNDGLYQVVGLDPGKYDATVQAKGFKTLSRDNITFQVGDKARIDFNMQVGEAAQTVTVDGSGLQINTTDASVSTVVDRKFVENMPLNGRSFQPLLTLAPGVVQVGTANGIGDTGDIVVNGQRTEANYFTVDGVSANTGTAVSQFATGGGISGGTPQLTVLGTTQSMVSIDALQEFRASTSTYSAEYGRTPGGQFSFSTRSGTDEWHASVFEYFRNDALDANNWFNNAAVPKISRLAERQNDFGGTLDGPLEIPGLYNGKDRTFFFFSYEGLRLTVPEAVQTYYVPDANLRTQAPPALQSFLNVFPIANGGEDGFGDGLAYYNLAYSAPSALDNPSIRLDHSFGNKLKVFGRYADTSSSSWTYAVPGAKINSAINIQTFTLGVTSSLTSTQTNDLRFNLTRNNLDFNEQSVSFGGNTPLDISTIPGPGGQPPSGLGSQVIFYLNFSGRAAQWQVLKNTNAQRQYNVTDTHSWSYGAHQVKFGVDWRRLTTAVNPLSNVEEGLFLSQKSVLANSADEIEFGSDTNVPYEPVFHNFSAFAQDEWKATRRLALSLGFRWDVNPPPGNVEGPLAYTVNQITDLATTQLAPTNTPLWNTDWLGFAPRAGLAYQLRQSARHESVVRTGFGLFYDTGNTQGAQGYLGGVGFSSLSLVLGNPFPLTAAQFAAAPMPSIAAPYNSAVYAFDPTLKLPYAMQWNFAVEQGLGANQTLTVNYVGSGARKLLAQFEYFPTNNPNFSRGKGLFITANRASSGYNALQLKYQSRLSHGLQALTSYTWSHSIDDNSTNFLNQNILLRSNSDFDVRHNFQAAITYDVQSEFDNPVASALLQHWGIDTRIMVHSGFPVDIVGLTSPDPVTLQELRYHPNRVPGQPTYLYANQYPGRRIINYNAFVDAPAGVQGDTPRNYAKSFDLVQADLALRREFPIRERVHMQFRAEAFNALNHPIFGSIYTILGGGPSQFGRARTTLNNAPGNINPLYQTGGPRSLQLALKLLF